MARSSIVFLPLTCLLLAAAPLCRAENAGEAVSSPAAKPFSVVLLNGTHLPVAALALQGEQFVVQTTTPGFTQGQTVPLTSVSHIDGERPAALDQAIALLLSNKPREARDVLDPFCTAQAMTAKIPGNFWVEAARVLLLCHAVAGDPKRCTELGRLIADATPQQGIDPFTNLGKALSLSAASHSADDRAAAIRMVLTDDQPASVQAYASFYLGQLFLKERKPAEALTCFFAVCDLFPSGCQMVRAAAELQAAELLSTQKQHSEALALVQSALLSGADTVIAQQAAKRLETLK